MSIIILLLLHAVIFPQDADDWSCFYSCLPVCEDTSQAFHGARQTTRQEWEWQHYLGPCLYVASPLAPHTTLRKGKANFFSKNMTISCLSLFWGPQFKYRKPVTCSEYLWCGFRFCVAGLAKGDLFWLSIPWLPGWTDPSPKGRPWFGLSFPSGPHWVWFVNGMDECV